MEFNGEGKDKEMMANKTHPIENHQKPPWRSLFLFYLLSVSFSRTVKDFLQLSLCNYGETNRKGARRAVMQSDPVIGPSTSSTPAMQEVNKARLFLTMSLHSVLYISFPNSPTDGSSISLSLRCWLEFARKVRKA